MKPGSRVREIQSIRRVEEEWLKFQAFLADPISNVEPLRRETVAQLDAWKMELQQILKQLNHGDLPGAWSWIAALLRRFSSWESKSPTFSHGFAYSKLQHLHHTLGRVLRQSPSQHHCHQTSSKKETPSTHSWWSWTVPLDFSSVTSHFSTISISRDSARKSLSMDIRRTLLDYSPPSEICSRST